MSKLIKYILKIIKQHSKINGIYYKHKQTIRGGRLKSKRMHLA